MPTLIHNFKPGTRNWKALHRTCLSMYLDGKCYAFATALHQGLGWPIIGLIIAKGVIRHVGVQGPDGELYDARGFVPKGKFEEPFGFPCPYDLRPVTINDLRRAGESCEERERSVRMARKMAETLWPELPWKESLAGRVSAFASELEELSRKHGLWIRSPVPAAAPLIAVDDEDAEGYILRPTVEGIAFTIDRYYR